MGERGRPTDYRPEFCQKARELCAAGATDFELAEAFEVVARTIYRWKAEHPEFSQAIALGKGAPDDRVEASLYHKAIGYTFESEKVFQFQGQIFRAATVEHVPPDTTAATFWLKNRRPDQWRDRQSLEHTGPDGGPIKTEDVSDMEAARRVAHLLTRALREPEKG